MPTHSNTANFLFIFFSLQLLSIIANSFVNLLTELEFIFFCLHLYLCLFKRWAAVVRSLLLQLFRLHYFGVRVRNDSIRLPGFLAKNSIRNSERVPSETQNQCVPRRGISHTLAHTQKSNSTSTHPLTHIFAG